VNRQATFFIVLPVVVVAAVIYIFARPPWTPLRIAGLIIAIPNFALLTLARIQLGNSFSITPQARALVTTGIYSRIRNPVYVFSTLGIIGFFLLLQKPYLFLLLLVIVPLQILRARQEARVLEERFGDEYRRYKAATWF
jgi:protein-S-isoprenylcysteine O-methyltransferase Ste14